MFNISSYFGRGSSPVDPPALQAQDPRQDNNAKKHVRKKKDRGSLADPNRKPSPSSLKPSSEFINREPAHTLDVSGLVLMTGSNPINVDDKVVDESLDTALQLKEDENLARALAASEEQPPNKDNKATLVSKPPPAFHPSAADTTKSSSSVVKAPPTPKDKPMAKKKGGSVRFKKDDNSDDDNSDDDNSDDDDTSDQHGHPKNANGTNVSSVPSPVSPPNAKTPFGMSTPFTPGAMDANAIAETVTKTLASALTVPLQQIATARKAREAEDEEVAQNEWEELEADEEHFLQKVSAKVDEDKEESKKLLEGKKKILKEKEEARMERLEEEKKLLETEEEARKQRLEMQMAAFSKTYEKRQRFREKQSSRKDRTRDIARDQEDQVIKNFDVQELVTSEFTSALTKALLDGLGGASQTATTATPLTAMRPVTLFDGKGSPSSAVLTAPGSSQGMTNPARPPPPAPTGASQGVVQPRSPDPEGFDQQTALELQSTGGTPEFWICVNDTVVKQWIGQGSPYKVRHLFSRLKKIEAKRTKAKYLVGKIGPWIVAAVTSKDSGQETAHAVVRDDALENIPTDPIWKNASIKDLIIVGTHVLLVGMDCFALVCFVADSIDSSNGGFHVVCEVNDVRECEYFWINSELSVMGVTNSRMGTRKGFSTSYKDPILWNFDGQGYDNGTVITASGDKAAFPPTSTKFIQSSVNGHAAFPTLTSDTLIGGSSNLQTLSSKNDKYQKLRGTKGQMKDVDFLSGDLIGVCTNDGKIVAGELTVDGSKYSQGLSSPNVGSHTAMVKKFDNFGCGTGPDGTLLLAGAGKNTAIVYCAPSSLSEQLKNKRSFNKTYGKEPSFDSIRRFDFPTRILSVVGSSNGEGIGILTEPDTENMLGGEKQIQCNADPEEPPMI